jgi:prolyl-tRNA editing enzyme YbaK/EbsC (Cys-tRNA(Pro) deacylase)
MSLQSVRAFLAERQLDLPIIELEVSTATVALAAEAHGVEPGRIAKTLAFRLNGEQAILLVASGDARIDNRKFKAALGKGKMLSADEVVELTGHPVGGVCPFGLAQPLPIYLDLSLRDFDEVLPAAGAIHSAIRISTAQLAEVTGGQWVCAVQRRRFPVGESPTRRNAPAGSNRSSYGGNEMAEAFG